MKIVLREEKQQKTDELLIKAPDADSSHTVHHARMSFLPSVYQIHCCVESAGLHLNKCKWQCKKLDLQLC